MDRLVKEVPILLEDRGTLQELERALVLREPPSNWAEAMEPVIESLWTNAATVEEQDHWRDLAYEVERQSRAA